ncbi:hypothetical protein [Pseudomonas viciae]|uniref:Uncharacterized protein n=1 Tax=Pseudomonas viciae TaxID=2505979 RepID=A0ABY8P8D7_9PSED|nr:hypothetical protein [Pseudomonas viciae]UZE84548.1 hypothetical protein LOY66_18295 [Pseudomonas viciae]WGO91469.1 hypothetical protein QCD61_17270 [Pseudomonas viciae]
MEALMMELKKVFVSLLGEIYLGLLLAIPLLSVMALKIKPSKVASLFIGGFSLPLSLFCYVVWVYASGPEDWSWVNFLFDLLAFAQIGWLGGALALVGVLIKVNVLKKAGLWVSIGSVVFHGLFLSLMCISGAGS